MLDGPALRRRGLEQHQRPLPGLVEPVEELEGGLGQPLQAKRRLGGGG